MPEAATYTIGGESFTFDDFKAFYTKSKLVVPMYSEIQTDKLLIGADPELFAFSPEKNTYMSLIGKFPGTKQEPVWVNEDIAIQVDNVLAEFNITPCSTSEEFVRKITSGIDVCTQRLQALGLDVSIVPSAILPASELSHPSCEVFGCEPDYNAWDNGQINPKPSLDEIVRMYNSKEFRGLRSAGGHIHIGFFDNADAYNHEVNHLDVVKACDYFLGLWSMIYDRDTYRRSLYGKPGCFRMKPYGIEYRTLSNFWLKDPALMQKAFDLAVFAYKVAVKNPKAIRDTSIPDILNSGNVDYALNHLSSWEKRDGFPGI